MSLGVKKNLLAILMVLFASSPATALAEESTEALGESKRRAFSLVVAGMQQALDFPFGTNLFTGPLHPGVMGGAEVEYVHGRYGRVFQTANVGYFSHAHVDRVLFLNTELAYGYDFASGLGLEVLQGLGYGHVFTDRQLYSLETGEAATDFGRPSVLLSLAQGLNYDLRAKDVFPVTFFVRYQFLFQFRFQPQSFLPVVPRTILFLGAKFHFDAGGK